MQSQSPETGWELVAQRDEAAPLIRALVTLDPDSEYTRSDIADAADISLKTLYLADVIDDFVELGMLDRVDDTASEASFTLNQDSDVFAAARTFDEAVTSAGEHAKGPDSLS